MHIDYIREQYHKAKNPKYSEPLTDLEFLKEYAIDDFVDFAHKIGDEKIRSICETMQKSFGYRHNSSFTKKRITSKQKYAIAVFLMKKFGTVEKVISEVFGISELEVALTEKEL